MMELIKCVYKTSTVKYKKYDKKTEIYLYISSIQDLIMKLFLKRSVLHLGTMKRLLHLRAKRDVPLNGIKLFRRGFRVLNNGVESITT